MTKTLLLLLLCSVLTVQGEKILMLFFPSYSHIRGSLGVAKELVSRGHVVWNALPTYFEKDERLRVPGIKHLSYTSTDRNRFAPVVENIIDNYFKTRRQTIVPGELKEICGLILRDEVLFFKAKSMKFDFVILSTLPSASMLTIFAYRLNLPFIFIGTSFNPDASRSPFVLPTSPFPVWGQSPKMDFENRFISSIAVFVISFIYNAFSDSKPVAIYAPEKPYISLEALTAKGLLWLVDLEPLLHYPQALLPNVKFVGSLSASIPKKLPVKYLKFMDEAKNGVVIVSFGSNVKKIPLEIFNRLIETFKQTDYNFIFKTDMVQNVTSEIMLTDWMPQSDLLAHPNVKLFITHCGSNGQNEAFLNGVPMLGFPIFAEQHFNAEKVVYKGFGLKMDLRSFRVHELVGNINELIKNSTYSQKIKKAAAITKLRERSPTDEAVYWIEHVIQYGGEHLRSYCQDMPLYQFLNLDVIGLLLFILHLSVFIIWKLCSCIFRRCCKQSSGGKRKQD